MTSIMPSLMISVLVSVLSVIAPVKCNSILSISHSMILQSAYVDGLPVLVIVLVFHVESDSVLSPLSVYVVSIIVTLVSVLSSIVIFDSINRTSVNVMLVNVTAVLLFTTCKVKKWRKMS